MPNAKIFDIVDFFFKYLLQCCKNSVIILKSNNCFYFNINNNTLHLNSNRPFKGVLLIARWRVKNSHIEGVFYGQKMWEVLMKDLMQLFLSHFSDFFLSV